MPYSCFFFPFSCQPEKGGNDNMACILTTFSVQAVKHASAQIICDGEKIAIARDENVARRCVFTMTTDGGFWCSLRVKFTETEIKHISRSFRWMWQCVKLYSLLKMSVYPFFFFFEVIFLMW